MDPYSQWLEIPRHLRPGPQLPPHHYDLLGIEVFSSNWTLIRAQVDRRMGLVKEHELGPHSAESQKLLRELAMARSVLLDSGRKTRYDEELRVALGIPGREGTLIQVPPTTAGSLIQTSEPVPENGALSSRLGKRRRKFSRH